MTRRQAERIAQERGRGAAYEEDGRAILRVRRVEGIPTLTPTAKLGRLTQAHVDALSPAERRVLELRFASEVRIAVDLLLPDGSVVDTVEGRTAEGVEREVLERGWCSTLSHAAWVGRELARAVADR